MTGADDERLARIVCQNEVSHTAPPGHEDIKFLLRLLDEHRAEIARLQASSADMVERARELVREAQDACGIYHSGLVGKITAALSTVVREAREGAQAGWRHKKRGTTYQYVGEANIQTAAALRDEARVVVYRGDDGRLWVRSYAEFHDGRFERVRVLAPPTEDTKP